MKLMSPISFLRILLSGIILLTPVTVSSAQEGSDTTEVKTPGFLLASAGFTTNRANPRFPNAIRRPAALTTLSYYHSSGLYASADYYKYFESSQSTWESEITAGFSKTWLDQFNLDASYGYHYFKGDSIFEGIPYRHAFGLSGAWAPDNFTLAVDQNLLLGGEKNYFLDLSLSYDIQFNKVLHPEGSLTFSPTITTSFGTTYWIPAMAYKYWKHKYGNGKMPPHFEPRREFEYQNLSLILPIQYSIGSFTVSAAGFWSKPSRELRLQQWTNQSGFLVSFTYALIFSK